MFHKALAAIAVSTVAVLHAEAAANPVYSCPTGPSFGGFIGAPNTDAADDIRNTKKFRFMHWNALWLYEPKSKAFYPQGQKPTAVQCPATGAPANAATCEWKTDGQAMAHFKKVAEIIGKYKPHMVNLVEIQGCNVLKSLTSEIGPAGAGGFYRAFSIDGNDERLRQNVGMLTQLSPLRPLMKISGTQHWPIPGNKCGALHPKAPKSGNEGADKSYFTTFKIPGLHKEVALIGVHLPAVPVGNASQCHRREAQAMVIKKLIAAQLQAGRHIIVAGDMNTWDGKTLDRKGNKPECRALEFLRSPGLINVAEKMPKHHRYTYELKPQWEASLDHILVDRELFNKVSRITVARDFPANVLDPTGDHYGGMYSDHYPLIMDIEL